MQLARAGWKDPFAPNPPRRRKRRKSRKSARKARRSAPVRRRRRRKHHLSKARARKMARASARARRRRRSARSSNPVRRRRRRHHNPVRSLRRRRRHARRRGRRHSNPGFRFGGSGTVGKVVNTGIDAALVGAGAYLASFLPQQLVSFAPSLAQYNQGYYGVVLSGVSTGLSAYVAQMLTKSSRVVKLVTIGGGLTTLFRLITQLAPAQAIQAVPADIKSSLFSLGAASVRVPGVSDWVSSGGLPGPGINDWVNMSKNPGVRAATAESF